MVMDGNMVTGLRHRLKRVVRQLADQHRHLKPIWAELAEAVARRSPAIETQEHHAHYLEALQAHFELEGRMFFPALHGLRPEWGDELESLVREHDQLRDELVQVRRELDAGRHDAGSRALERFSERLGRHEAREESLMARLEDEAS